MIDILYKVWMNWMKFGRGAEFLKKSCKIGNFAKVHRMTPNQAKGIGHQKYLPYLHNRTPSPKFSSIFVYD